MTKPGVDSSGLPGVIDCSSAVAERLSIRDRGELREGMFADIMIFDPNTIIDRGTYERPHQLSVGVRYVFVNGVAVVDEAKVTGAKPGVIVRGPGWVRGSARRVQLETSNRPVLNAKQSRP